MSFPLPLLHADDAGRGADALLDQTPNWRPTARYADQPMSLGTQLVGLAGIFFVSLLIAAGALLTFTTFQPQNASPALSVFNVAPPASLPEPPRDTPPGPEQIETQSVQPTPDLPRINPPEVLLPTNHPQPIALPTPPAAPAEKSTAPQVKPAPPALQQSDNKPTWEGQVLSALNKVKRYPRLAMVRRQQGAPYIRFVMNREGHVLSSRLERSSGSPDLDREAVALPKRASPLPKPPQDKPGEMLEVVVPVEFFLR